MYFVNILRIYLLVCLIISQNESTGLSGLSVTPGTNNMVAQDDFNDYTPPIDDGKDDNNYYYYYYYTERDYISKESSTKVSQCL